MHLEGLRCDYQIKEFPHQRTLGSSAAVVGRWFTKKQVASWLCERFGTTRHCQVLFSQFRVETIFIVPCRNYFCFNELSSSVRSVCKITVYFHSSVKKLFSEFLSSVLCVCEIIKTSKQQQSRLDEFSSSVRITCKIKDFETTPASLRCAFLHLMCMHSSYMM